MHNSLASNAASVPRLRSEALTAIPMHVLQFAADESLIDFHAAAFSAAKFSSHRSSLNDYSEPMKHKPSGLLRDAKITVNLVRRNPVLAVDQHPQSREPLL